jgi:glycosyltransferase involved in cell wall biosynthesis
MTKNILVFSALPGLGGLQSMVLGMSKALSSLGHQVTVALPGRSAALRIEPRPTTFHGFPAVSLASLRSYYILFNTWNWGANWRRYLSTFDAAVVVAGSPYIAVPFLDSSTPVYVWSAVTMREDLKGRLENFSALKKLAYRLALPLVYGDERRVLERCAHCWTLSATTLDDLQRELGKPVPRVSVLLPPIDCELFCPSTPPGSEPKIIFAGRYDDTRKNTPMLLRAMRRVREVIPRATLTLVGTRRVPDDLRRMAAELGISTAVDFLEEVDHETLSRAYRSAQVFALPSWQEGLCIAALEGMACGLPVVSTRCGGPETFVSDDETGHLVRPDDDEAMARYLIQLLGDTPLRERLSGNARQFVETHCGLPAFVGEIGARLSAQVA